MLSRIYYAVATTALVATMGVLEGAQHAQSLKFRMNQSPQKHVLKVRSYVTGKIGDIEILVTRKEENRYIYVDADKEIPITQMCYYGTYITKEFSGRKFEPNPTVHGESLVAVQNDSNLTITLFTLTESDEPQPGVALVYNNPSIIPSEFQKAASAATDSLIESLDGKSGNEFIDALAEAGVNFNDLSLAAEE